MYIIEKDREMTFYNSSTYNNYMSRLLEGYYKISDTIKGCLTEDHIDTVDAMFYYYCIRMHKNLIELRKYTLKHVIFCPVQTIKDYYSYKYMYEHLVDIIKRTLDGIHESIEDTKKSQNNQLLYPKRFIIKGFTNETHEQD